MGASEVELRAAEILGTPWIAMCSMRTSYCPGGVSVESGNVKFAFVVDAPFDPVIREGRRPKLIDLEPVAGAIVVVDMAGSLGHIGLKRSRVQDGGIIRKAEPNLVAGLHLHNTSLSSVLQRSGVAAEAVSLYRLGRHVAVGVLADIFVVAVVDEVGKNIVSRGWTEDGRKMKAGFMLEEVKVNERSLQDQNE
jgi:hypothetical protein